MHLILSQMQHEKKKKKNSQGGWKYCNCTLLGLA